LRRLLAAGRADVEAGRTRPAKDVFDALPRQKGDGV
jgi:hypothetical protein